MVDAATQRELRVAGYETPRPDVLALVPTTVRNVLELGCSTGSLGAEIKRRQPASIVGVELDPDYAEQARHRLDRVVVSDAAAFARSRPVEAPFDCLICADVLEHLEDPWSVLEHLSGLLSPGATVIVSLPNVLWYRSLTRLLRERRWPREPEGIFDATHARWFSRSDGTSMLEDAGFSVRHIEQRYWEDRRSRLAVYRLLDRTRLVSFTAAQHIIVAQKPVV